MGVVLGVYVGMVLGCMWAWSLRGACGRGPRGVCGHGTEVHVGVVSKGCMWAWSLRGACGCGL